MRTPPEHRGRGVAQAILAAIVNESLNRGYRQLSLETGSAEVFAPARRLYLNNGFSECEPFADYLPDPHSVFMVRDL